MDCKQKAAAKIWTMSDGREVAIADMCDRHLLLAHRMLLKKGFIGPRALNAYLHSRGPSGDMAQLAFEAEMDQAFEARVSPFVDYFEDEMRIRQLSSLTELEGS